MRVFSGVYRPYIWVRSIGVFLASSVGQAGRGQVLSHQNTVLPPMAGSVC